MNTRIYTKDELLEESYQYLEAIVGGGMSRNNSENLAGELMDKIDSNLKAQLKHEIATIAYAGTDVMKPPLNSKITLTMDFGLIGEQTVVVEYVAYPAERETRLEPGSPAELEIISATVPELGIDISEHYEVETLYAALKEVLE